MLQSFRAVLWTSLTSHKATCVKNSGVEIALSSGGFEGGASFSRVGNRWLESFIISCDEGIQMLEDLSGFIKREKQAGEQIFCAELRSWEACEGRRASTRRCGKMTGQKKERKGTESDHVTVKKKNLAFYDSELSLLLERSGEFESDHHTLNGRDLTFDHSELSLLFVTSRNSLNV
jgi:hypothetical protein